MENDLRNLLRKKCKVSGPLPDRNDAMRVVFYIDRADIKYYRLSTNFDCGEFACSLLELLEKEMEKNASTVTKVNSQNRKLRKAIKRLAGELSIKDREIENIFNSLNAEAEV